MGKHHGKSGYEEDMIYIASSPLSEISETESLAAIGDTIVVATSEPSPAAPAITDLPQRDQRPKRAIRVQSIVNKEDEVVAKAAAKKIVRKKAAKRSKWDAESLLTDPKSPLATANLRNLLCNATTWELLGEKEQQEILSFFPDNTHIINDGFNSPKPDFAALKNDDSFLHDCAAYTENIAQGRHDIDWLASAWAAHQKRKAGAFNAFLATKLSREWGIELPEQEESAEQSTGDGNTSTAP